MFLESLIRTTIFYKMPNKSIHFYGICQVAKQQLLSCTGVSSPQRSAPGSVCQAFSPIWSYFYSASRFNLSWYISKSKISVHLTGPSVSRPFSKCKVQGKIRTSFAFWRLRLWGSSWIRGSCCHAASVKAEYLLTLVICRSKPCFQSLFLIIANVESPCATRVFGAQIAIGYLQPFDSKPHVWYQPERMERLL